MEKYGQVVAYALPVFVVLILMEMCYGMWKKTQYYALFDTISSLMSGMTNAVKDVLGLSMTIIAYGWLLKHLAVIHLEQSILMYVIVFVTLDFQGYWTHRWAHEINFFWNKHLVHHSSEEFNLACALRQSISSFVNVVTFFLIPAAFLGVPEVVIATIAPLHLFAQFWYHTRHIEHMGWLEHVIVTPAHHRVHHAINPQYLDKNYGQIFIFWDKLFGTFQAELKEVPAVYGITRPVQTFNPILINFQHMWLLATDAWRTKHLVDKLRIWFMPTGWRPADVEKQYPLAKIVNIYDFQKYDTIASPGAKLWTILFFVFNLANAAYFFSHIGQIGVPGIYTYGIFIYLSIFSFAEWLDANPYAIVYKILSSAFGLWVMYSTNAWFGLHSPALQLVIASFLICSVVIALVFPLSKSNPYSPLTTPH